MRRNKIPRITCEAVQAGPSQLGQLGNVQREILSNVSLQMKADMDLSVLPNNNHPDKFLQLDVRSLMRTSALLQAGLVRFPGGNYPAAQHWQNLIYS
ncbi:hypothetical protein E2I00_018687, partial [Balaenoptera physalus]